MQSITRRDFINGAALTVAAGLTPAAQIAAQPCALSAAAARTARAACRLVRGRACLRARPRGIFRRGYAGRGALRSRRGRRRHQRACRRMVLSPHAARKDARILILDNHDDFGGHAKRNEFMLDGRLIIGYGGSQSIDNAEFMVERHRQGTAARARRRRAAVRDRVRARPLFVARSVARDVLCRAKRSAATPGDRRCPDPCRATR